MVDWFVILTPLLLAPIALLFVFVGCSLLFTARESNDISEANEIAVARFHIRFYVVSTREEHEFEFKIYNQSVLISAEQSTVELQKEGQNGKASIVGHGFTHLLPPGTATLTCEVFDKTAPLPEDVPLINESGGCQDFYSDGEEYLVLFNAGASADEMVPAEGFEPCVVILL